MPTGVVMGIGSDKYINAVLLKYTQNPPQHCRLCLFSFYTSSYGDTMECTIDSDNLKYVYADTEGCGPSIFTKALMEIL